MWPNKWKIEHGTAIPKNGERFDEEDTRIISITNHMSKLMDKFVFQWLIQYIGSKLDSDQFGAITHYLIDDIFHQK